MAPGRTLVIVPAYNEEASVAHVVHETRCACPDLDILVVNDGSLDNTAEVARQAGAMVLSLPSNLGIGGAMQTGFLFAAAQGYDYAVQVDGDGQHEPDQLPALLAPLWRGEADVVVGSRYLTGEGYQSTRARVAGAQLFAAVVTWLTGQRLTDTTSGFRACNKAAIAFCAHEYPTDYPEVEALCLLHQAGFRITEVPVTMRARSGGKSSIDRPRAAYYVMKVLLAVGIGRLRQPRQPRAPSS